MKKITAVFLTFVISFGIISAIPSYAVKLPDYFPNTYKNTGNQLEDLIGVALSQNGYYDFERDKITPYYGELNGYTKYSEWMAESSYGWAWCASFVSWCANQAGIPNNIVVCSYRCQTMLNEYKNRGVFHKSNPARGDIMFFDSNHDGISEHVAIVTDVFDDGIYTIQGNHEYSEGSWKCAKVFYPSDDERIYGYASPAYSGKSIPVYNSENPFRDVFRNEWYFGAVEYCYANNVVNGISRFEFAPQQTLTRAMFVKMLMSHCGADTANYQTSYFEDVPEGEWFTPSVAWAYENGIVNGVSESHFKPSKPITRQDVVTILYRYYKVIHNKVYYPEYEVFYHFDDYKAVDIWALEPVAWAIEQGMIDGNGEGMLMPKGLTTRAQSVQMIYNFDLKYKRG
ncbi:MAG: CHAP domain-containing protein [Ruminococcaceae bacterium]|nr:CHAP domain-containing protein [Oscillospiraceae bacterium]